MKSVFLLLFFCLLHLHRAKEQKSLRALEAPGGYFDEHFPLAERKQKGVKRGHKKNKNLNYKKKTKKGRNKKRITNRRRKKKQTKKNCKNIKNNMKTRTQKMVKRNLIKPRQNQSKKDSKNNIQNKRKGNKKSRKQKKKIKEKEEMKIAFSTQRHNTEGVRLLQYMKNFSVALTQSQRAIRIAKKPLIMDLYNSSNRFEDVLNVLNLATSGGTTCTGDPSLVGLVTIVYSALQRCDDGTGMGRCNRGLASILPGLTSASATTAARCKPKLKKFVEDCRKSIFGATNFQDAYTNLEGITPNAETLQEDGCLPGTFQGLNAGVETYFRECKDPNNLYAGSWGTCNEYLLGGIDLIDLCSPPTWGTAFFTQIESYKNYVDQSWKIDNLNQHIENMCILSGKNPVICSACSAATNDPQTTCRRRINPFGKRPRTTVNFTQVASAMKDATEDGTTCNGSPIPVDAKNVYDVIKNCSVSIQAICSTAHFIKKLEDLNQPTCYPLVDEFINEYEVVVNKTNNAAKQTELTEKEEQIMKTPMSGYNLKLIRNCVPHFCYTPSGCPLDLEKIITTLPVLNKQFLFSFEFIALNRYVIEFTEHIEGKVVTFLSLTVDKKNGTVCSNTDTCFFMKNVFKPGELHHVEISQTEESGTYIFRAKIDGTKKIEEQNKITKTFSNGVSVYTNRNLRQDSPSSLNESMRNLFINPHWPKVDLCEGTSRSRKSKASDISKVTELAKKLDDANCSRSTDDLESMEAETKAAYETCRDSTVIGSYANCEAMEKAASAYTIACKITSAGSLTTAPPRRRKVKKLKFK